MISGIGIVVSGLVKAGTASVGDKLLLGPGKDKMFREVIVKSIHQNRDTVNSVKAGQLACLNIRARGKNKETLNRSDIRKGMSIIYTIKNTEPVWEFEADVVILNHATTVKTGYNAVAHIGVIRQAVSIIKMKKVLLRSKEKGILRFRFLYNAEMIKPG